MDRYSVNHHTKSPAVAANGKRLVASPHTPYDRHTHIDIKTHVYISHTRLALDARGGGGEASGLEEAVEALLLHGAAGCLCGGGCG